MKSSTLVQCQSIQNQLLVDFFACADLEIRTKIAIAWDRMADRQRIIRGRPLPGSYRPDREAPRLSVRNASAVLMLPEEVEAQVLTTSNVVSAEPVTVALPPSSDAIVPSNNVS